MGKEERKPRILAVTSGKGGTGKTSLAVNLALCLRLFDAQVLLLDADMGLGSVDVLLRLNVRRNLRDVVLGRCALEEAIIIGPRGLRILPGASGIPEMAQMSEEQMAAFLDQVERFCASMDFIVVDTSPGISPSVISCLAAADEVILVVNPEPTALTDAYALLKVFSRYPESHSKSILVVVNRTGSKEEALHGFDRLRAAAERFLGLKIEYLGSMASDETVPEAVKRQVAFLTHYAASACSRDVRKIAARLVSSTRGGSSDWGRFFKALGEVDE